MKDYIAAAQMTAADDMHGQLVGFFYFLKYADEFIAAAKKLDAIKRALFYGKPLPDIGAGHDWGGVHMNRVDVDCDIIHGILGCATEGSEMLECLVAHMRGSIDGTSSELDFTNLKEECGDNMWFLALIFGALDTDFHTEGRRNIAKLLKRFPNGFSRENALVRDIQAERGVLEASLAA